MTYGKILDIEDLRRYVSESRDARDRIDLAFLCVGILLEIYSAEKLTEIAHTGGTFGRPLIDIFARGSMKELICLKFEIEARIGGPVS